MSLPLIVVALLVAPPEETPATLRVGEPTTGEIRDDGMIVESPGLVDPDLAPAHGIEFRIVDDGPMTVTLRSVRFDGYLVARDAEGEVVAEDDDGWYWLHSRIVLETAVRRPVTVFAVAKDAQTGAFEITASEGVSPPPSRDGVGEIVFGEAVQVLSILPEVRDSRLLVSYGRSFAVNDRLEDARRLFDRSVEAERERFGENHPRTVDRMDKLVKFLRDHEMVEEALPILERLLKIAEGTSGSMHPITSRRLTRLAHALRELGRLAEAQPLFERELSIRETARGRDHLLVTPSLNDLGMVLMERGRYEEARPYFERALSILESSGRPEDELLTGVLANLGSLSQYQGRFGDATTLFERALAIEEEILGPSDPGLTATLSNLAMVHRQTGRFEDAKTLLERALAIEEAFHGPRHSTIALTLGNLGAVLQDLGQVAAAKVLYERSLSIREERLGPTHPLTAMSLNNIALLLSEQGSFDEARPLYERALAISEESLGGTHRITARIVNNLGMLLRGRGRVGEALPHFERSVAISEEVFGPDHPDTATCRNNLAIAWMDSRDPKRARATALSAVTHLGRHISHQAADLSAGRRLRSLAGLFWHLETLMSVGRNDDAGAGEIAEAVLSWKGQARRAAGGQLGVRRVSDARDRELLRRVQSLSSQLSTRMLASSISDRERHDQEITRLRHELARADEDLQRRAARDPNWRAIDVESVRSALPDGAALVDLLVHGVYEPARWRDGEVVRNGGWREGLATAFVYRSDRDEPRRVELGFATEIAAAIRAPLAEFGALRGHSPPVTSGETGARLRELVWDPLLPIIGDARHVFVAPDGVLGTLPWEVIPNGKGGFLVEEYEFTYLSDASALVRMRESGAPLGQGVVAAGGFDYARRADSLTESALTRLRGPLDGGFERPWSTLPETRDEAALITDLYAARETGPGEAVLLTGASATEEAIKKIVEGRRFVHLATHGYFQPDGLPSMWESVRRDGRDLVIMREAPKAATGLVPGLLSGLVCAGANEPVGAGTRDNGLLTASEVSWLDLSGCELIVLSACETALGESRSGEGMISLQSAFHQAGARAVIASLWRVPDDATAELMKNFYTRLWVRGERKGAALRGAKLDMIRKNRETRGSALPATWGAFVLSGDWR